MAHPKTGTVRQTFKLNPLTVARMRRRVAKGRYSEFADRLILAALAKGAGPVPEELAKHE